MKMYLMTPGPTPVAPETQLAMAQPIIHHRSPLFMEIFNKVREDLKYLFQTEQEVLVFTATGTGAMEGSVTNLLSAGDTALVVDGGKFGERWTEIAKSTAVEVARFRWNGAGPSNPRPLPSCCAPTRPSKRSFSRPPKPPPRLPPGEGTGSR